MDKIALLKLIGGGLVFIALNGVINRTINPQVDLDKYYQDKLEHERVLAQRDSALKAIEDYETKYQRIAEDYSKIDSLVSGYDSTELHLFWADYLK